MREIKFRAWDKKKEEMVVLTSNAFKGLLLDDCFEALQEEFELMQYVGLKDKNGKEIYEGDIVKVGDELLEIEWDNHSSCFHAFLQDTKFEENDYNLWSADVSKESGVIGNIYENPELLTNKK